MSKKIEKICAKLDEIRESLEALAEEAQNVFESRTDRWQESEKGEECACMITALEDAASSVQDAYDYISDYA